VWEYLGEGVYTSWLFGSWTQPVYRGEGTQLYKLPGCIAEGYDIEFELTEDGQHLAKAIAKQETGYVHSSYGMISISSAVDADGNVTITAAEGDIFYTTDGSNPTSSSTAYSAAFAVEDGTVVKAIAVVVEADPETGDDVEYVSSVATKKYTAAGSSDPTPPSGSFVVYKGTPVLSYDRMEDQNAVGAYFEEVITPEPIKGLTKSTVTNVYQDLTFTGTDEDDDHMSTAVYAVPASAEPIKPGIMFAGELKESTGYHKFNVTIDGVEYVVFALKAGLADASTTIEVYFRPSFD
jgi:hypothetical protein